MNDRYKQKKPGPPPKPPSKGADQVIKVQVELVGLDELIQALTNVLAVREIVAQTDTPRQSH